MVKNDNQQENQKAINYIVENIKAGKLIVGSKIPSERDLAEEIGIGRSSTREAISILRGMGLVESRHGSGNYISNNTDKSIKQVVEIMLSLGSISQTDVVGYRRVISAAIGMILIQQGLSDEFDRKIQNILQAMECMDDEEFARLDREFHLTLIQATENTLFITVMEPIGEIYLDMVYPVIMSSDDDDRNTRLPLHRNIYESIRAKDLEAFSEAMQAHYDFVDRKIKMK